MSQKNKKIKYSIIYSSKNEEKDIHFLIKSFNKILKKNIELIFIDDSQDKTKKIIKSYIKKDHRIN